MAVAVRRHAARRARRRTAASPPTTIRAALRPAAYYRSDLALVVLENTHNLAGGTVADAEPCAPRSPPPARRAARPRRRGPPLERGGGARRRAAARWWRAPTPRWSRCRRGCARPRGRCSSSSRARIEEARRVRKQLGGGMRQVGHPGRRGPGRRSRRWSTAWPRTTRTPRLLARGPGRLPGRARDARRGRTSWWRSSGARRRPTVAADLAARGVLASVMDARTLRLVTHHDVDGDACARAAARVARGAGLGLSLAC